MTQFDVLVVGSGVAGLSAAQRLSSSTCSVGLVTKSTLFDSTTAWAQGGVAAVLGESDDSIDLHVDDTLAAGAGLCDRDAVQLLIEEGPDRLIDLIKLGATFDIDIEGRLALSREGGHSRARVVHAGGAATGREVQRTLVDAVRATSIQVLEHHTLADVLLGDAGVRGIKVFDAQGMARELLAPHVVVATGGAGQMYSMTTNPVEATGDGVAAALRAGVEVADVEFMQFHPTALHVPQAPRPLLSEALRGEGALLRDAAGERFVDELSSRDVVARAMAKVMATESSEWIWLDATMIDRFSERFPSLGARLAQAGIDPSTDWIPVSPAAHHWAGGIMTDLNGASMCEGLWAVGEVADAGVHGANRLASNSLLEGLVFGTRVAAAILGGARGPEPTGVLRPLLGSAGDAIGVRAQGVDDVSLGTIPDLRGSDDRRRLLQHAMARGAGLVRSREGLLETLGVLTALAGGLDASVTASDVEDRNLIDCSMALVRSALQREESRGSHVRVEYEGPSDKWITRVVVG
jgi:L-aspartate oxidase